MYGVTGVPTVVLDGSRQSVGGGDGCNSAYNRYLNLYNQRMSETGGVSPVSVSGYFSVYGNSGSIQATFRLEDPVSLSNLQGTLFIYEDDITWCCGGDGASHWDEIVRMAKSEPVTLTNVGDQATIVREITVDPNWNPANLHAVAILQQTSGNKQIIQSARLTNVVDFALSIPRRVGSVPTGSGAAIFPGTIQNVSSSSDVLTLSVDQAMGWPTDFQVEGDGNWYTSHAFTLAPGETRALSIRVQTDAVKRIGSGSFTARSGNSGRSQPATMRLFNGSHSVLFVDNDNGQTWGSGGPQIETPFINALNNLGYLYDNWNVYTGHAGATPAFPNMAGFDVMIWETGYQSSSPMSQNDITAVEQYLDSGGRLFLSSMDLLTVPNIPTSFTTNYLGVASWSNNTKCHTASGVPGDPITDGMVLPLNWFSNDQPDRVDTVNPTADAAAIFFSEHTPPHPNAVRYEAGDFRVVFSTIIQNAISETAPAPNNSQTVIDRTLDWLLEPGVDAVPAPPSAALQASLNARPNPCSSRSELTFTLSPSGAASPVHLTLVDASGRLVRTLVNGKLGVGRNSVVWDGKDDGGRAAAAGLYFARLKTGEGETSQKLILVQ